MTEHKLGELASYAETEVNYPQLEIGGMLAPDGDL